MKSFSRRAGIAMLSTSSPMAVSLSAMVSASASVSRCSFSQDKREFHLLTAPIQGGDVERGKAVMPQPAQIGFKKAANIGNGVFQHRHAVQAEAEGEALIAIGIDAAIGQHRGCTMPLPPSSSQSLPWPNLIWPGTRRSQRMSHSSDWLGEGEKAGPGAQFDLVDLEKGLAEFLHRPFQMAQMNAFIHHQGFDLMEHGRMGGVGIHAIGAARRNDADRRLAVQHGAHLHRRGVGAQNMSAAVRLRRDIERVLHLARRMIGRNIQLGEIVIVEFDVRAFGDGKAHIGEDGGDFFQHLGNGMHAALRLRRAAAG